MFRAMGVALLLALAAPAAAQEALRHPAPARAAPAAAVRLAPRTFAAAPDVADRALAIRFSGNVADAGAACVLEWCPPRVEVPGLATTAPRASAAGLLLPLLDRSSVEPVASAAWWLQVTGLRMEWTPGAVDRGGALRSGGLGRVFFRIRLRLDSSYQPVIPPREEDRLRRARELDAERAAVAERERAREAERVRAVVGPAGPPPAREDAAAPDR
jgi:hypothetical protein